VTIFNILYVELAKDGYEVKIGLVTRRALQQRSCPTSSDLEEDNEEENVTQAKCKKMDEERMVLSNMIQLVVWASQKPKHIQLGSSYNPNFGESMTPIQTK
jgi:hypothetical protein